MTEKRFDFKYEYITLDGWVFATAKDKQNAELISRTLNQLYDDNEQLKSLKEEIIRWKSKYFEAMDTVINEYSTNIKKDMEKLKKEVWGECE